MTVKNRKNLSDRLSVKEYTRLRVVESLTDEEVMKSLGYSKGSRRLLQKWKDKHNVPMGKSKIDLIPPDVIEKELQYLSVGELCEKYNVKRPTLRRYLHTHDIEYVKWSRI